HTNFTVKTSELLICFGERQTVAIGGNHRESVRLEDQKTTIQRVTRFFHGDGELRLADEALEHSSRDLHQCMWHSRQRREIFLCHANHLVLLFVANNFNPVIIQKLELDLAFREETDEFQEFLGRYGASSVLLDFGLTGGAN